MSPQVLATAKATSRLVENNLQVSDIKTEKRGDVHTCLITVLRYIIILAVIEDKVL